MAVDDPPLPCIGSVHVPGCVHTTPPPPPPVRELAMTLEIRLIRRGRRRCPTCRFRRELFSINAFAVDQPVGYGEARCLECAGLRR